MKGIGIVGAGIAALQLGLYLQKHGVPVTIYSDRTADAIRASRLPNTVARFEHTRARERALGVHHWEFPGQEISSVHFRINGDAPLSFRGHPAQPASFVDMRIYQARLLEDFAQRGGEVLVAALHVTALPRVSQQHDLLVIASGRDGLSQLFPRIPELSPYSQPQRRLLAGLFHGIAFPSPAGMSFNIAPGHGEVFQSIFYSFDGLISNLLIEAVPGQGLEPITQLRYEDDPRHFEKVLLEALREHAPPIYERVDPLRFQLTRPLDLIQGAITPTVRQGYARLENGRYIIALGDVHILNDPILGQGANTASQAAWILGQELLNGGPFDGAFCRRVERRIWEYARPITEWTNASLQPPAPHVIETFIAASQIQQVADQIVDNFNAPERNWEIFSSPFNAAHFLEQHGWQSPVAA